MKNTKKKIRVSNILLVVFIVIAIILTILLVIRYSERNKNEKAVREVVAEVKNISRTDEKELPYIEYGGYQVIGTIQIDKIDIEYPILIESTEDSLSKSITRVGNGKVNEVGNLTLAGHNYIDGSMFGKIDKLEKGDIISILDLYGNKVEYVISEKYITDPNDTSILECIEKDRKEITLLTCTNGNKNRLIIKASENLNK